MGVDLHLAAVVLLLAAPLVITQTTEPDCSYMAEIPRPARPEDWPELNFDGQTWSDRPLIPAPDREDLCMGQYYAAVNTGTQIIYMEEEIQGDIPIAKLNYEGTSTPYVVPQFLSGRSILLGAEVRNVDGEWFLYVTQRQDFEQNMQFYMFEVRIEGVTQAVIVSLTIVNIDDNPPMIQVFEACRVPELGDARLTECVYDVTDADGEISTSVMTFSVNSDRSDDEDIFYMEGHVDSSDWFTMTMTVGIRSALNFETNALHIFSVTAFDSLPNNHTATLMVQVDNVEHRPPRWVEIFAVQQFDEKTAMNFTVRAIDGDTAINKAIYYELITDEEDTFFSITTLEGGYDGAILHVEPIDRDALQREVFQFTIVAYKFDNRTFSTEAPVVIIINDINDQIPEPLHDEYRISIPEETPMSLNFEEEFGFYDRDLGENAQYSVRLESVTPENVANAFYIAPEVGYQRQTFIMGTVDHGMLDYEVEEFQNIVIRVIATDMNNNSLVGEAMLYIDLINWNDENPIFEQSSYSVSFNETEGEGFFVATVRADDRDIDDRVVHSLMGNVGEYLRIDEDTGDIYVSADDAFDYHRQSEIFVQVRAVDTLGDGPYNTATAQLVIELNDINNTPPTLRLPRGSPQVEENVPEGFEITDEIRATDPDTSALLTFEIDWETSYATKQGRETPAEEFHECLEIETIYPDPANTGAANGRLVVKEIRDNVTIDFEEFEVLYLTVRVRDEMTVIGEETDEMTFTIIIVDMNDNAPVWAEGTLETEFRVRENSTSNVVIGSVLATDIDGPLYNQVRYTIQPLDDTPEGLVKIDFYTGQITVDTDYMIDADIPPRFYLNYRVIASDRCYTEPDCPPDPTYWDTPGDISIYIIDTNNKMPVALTDQFQTEVRIMENSPTGTEVVQLRASDQDRDEIYNTVRYQINYVIDPALRRFFTVDLDSGLVTVYYTTEAVLDRDGTEPTHRIFITLIDNFYSEGEGSPHQIPLEILVILEDENDNAPELPDPSQLRWPISEGLAQGVRLSPDIHAHDRDEPGTDNSRVAYSVLELRPRDRDIQVPDLFDIITLPVNDQLEYRGELETTQDLRGYWGTYDIHIMAYDHGVPQMNSTEWYEIEISPYNFNAPVFVFPTTGHTVRLAKERATANGLLVTVGDAFLDAVAATDEDGLHAGTVTFQIVGNGEAMQYFEVENIGDNTGNLRLRQVFDGDVREFQVTIRATDGGTDPGPLSTDTVLTLVYVPTLGDPVFSSSTATVAFFEQEVDGERHQLPLAEDLKNYLCDTDCYNIYYSIIDGDSEGHFALDPETNILRVVRALDREVAVSHVLSVAASNSPSSGAAAPSSILTVTVNVREANPRPYFVRSLYTAGISASDTINRELLTVQATHSENAAVSYSIDQSSMQVDSSLEAVRDSAFTLNSETGVLVLNFQPTSSMHGMFEFDVLATDPADATDRTEVKIYLISSQNRVIFIFVNTLTEIEQNRSFIEETFSTGFGFTCNIDQIVPSSDASGIALDERTEVRAHFIRDDVPVPADEIERLRSDTQLLFSIQIALRSQELLLRDFVTDSSPEAGADSAQLAVYALAALSAALAVVCLVLLLAFLIRTRALNRRLEALSMTKYGSVDSGLNRAGLAAPGTNKHAVEGSNPIWNESIKAPDFDAISEQSNDSDLIGIEDLPQFRSDYFPPADTNSFTGVLSDNPTSNPLGSIPNHSNNFGFNTSPFSSEFTDRQFRMK